MPSAEVILYAGAKRLLDRNIFILLWFCAVFAKLISPRTVKCHVVWYIMSKKRGLHILSVIAVNQIKGSHFCPSLSM